MREPEIKQVQKIMNKDGSLRGFLWQDKFVPNDEENELFRLISGYIEDGNCSVEEQSLSKFDKPEVQDFVLGVYFDSQWSSIETEAYAIIEYEYGNPKAPKYHVSFKNLYCSESQPVESIIAKSHGASCFKFPRPNGEPRGCVIEIELPVKNLINLFNCFRSNMHFLKRDISYLLDELEMHLAQTGRSKRQGPTTQWLIDHLWEYDTDFIRDVGNRALEYFSLRGYSFEDQNIKHISDRDIYARHYIIRRHVGGITEWHKLALFQDTRFTDMGRRNGPINEESYYDIANKARGPSAYPYAVPYELKAKYIDLPQKKVRTMLEQGLTLEALCILNGFLEVQFRAVLESTMKTREGQRRFEQMGHARILEYFKNLCNQRSIVNGALYLSNAEKIYSLRNNYLHALIYPEESPFLTNKKRTELEQLMKPFIGAYESHQLAVFFDSLQYTLEHNPQDF